MLVSTRVVPMERRDGEGFYLQQPMIRGAVDVLQVFENAHDSGLFLYMPALRSLTQAQVRQVFKRVLAETPA